MSLTLRLELGGGELIEGWVKGLWFVFLSCQNLACRLRCTHAYAYTTSKLDSEHNLKRVLVIASESGRVVKVRKTEEDMDPWKIRLLALGLSHQLE